VIVGAPAYDAGESDEGAAFVFLGGGAGVAHGGPASAAARLQADQAFASLGSSVAGAGDVNGDGIDDVIVGAPRYDTGESDAGVAFVFLGGNAGIANGSPASAAARFASGQVGARLGHCVAGAGDVNADGYADVVVGARRYDAAETDEGAVFVFPGGAPGVAAASP
jgi:hypothetical protein